MKSDEMIIASICCSVDSWGKFDFLKCAVTRDSAVELDSWAV